MKFEFNWPSVSEEKMFENVDGRTDDGRTDAGVTGILIAHLRAFGSGELKSLILASAPSPKVTQWSRTQAFKLKSCLICFISIAALPACKISAKNINNCLSYCEI